MASEPDLSTTLALDEDEFTAATSLTLTGRLCVRNSTGDPALIAFPSSQIFDLEICDDQGNVVYSWSKGKAFAQILTEIQIQYEKDYPISAEVGSLLSGKYVVHAWLTATGPARVYSASARFHVK